MNITENKKIKILKYSFVFTSAIIVLSILLTVLTRNPVFLAVGWVTIGSFILFNGIWELITWYYIPLGFFNSDHGVLDLFNKKRNLASDPLSIFQLLRIDGKLKLKVKLIHKNKNEKEARIGGFINIFFGAAILLMPFILRLIS